MQPRFLQFGIELAFTKAEFSFGPLWNPRSTQRNLFAFNWVCT